MPMPPSAWVALKLSVASPQALPCVRGSTSSCSRAEMSVAMPGDSAPTKKAESVRASGLAVTIASAIARLLTRKASATVRPSPSRSASAPTATGPAIAPRPNPTQLTLPQTAPRPSARAT